MEQRNGDTILIMGARAGGKSLLVEKRMKELEAQGHKVVVLDSTRLEEAARALGRSVAEVTEAFTKAAKAFDVGTKPIADLEKVLEKIKANEAYLHANTTPPPNLKNIYDRPAPPPKGNFRRQFGGVNDHLSRKRNKRR